MNRFLLMTALVLFSSCFTGCIQVTPNPGGGPGGIRTNNVNTTNENSQIRLWILTQKQIANPPTTKMEAMQLDSYVQPRFRTFTFNRNPGTYYVVASNESHYQSLGNNAPFSPGVDFSLLEVVVEQELIPVSVRNSATPTLLPVITNP
jgi:hypothetical protein